ncbi:MAG TPA: hypothetical protein PKH79_13190 [Prolixibacteraceae bacterium]|nr:hypothetical protein [Prolixibacteraceae bacterium]
MKKILRSLIIVVFVLFGNSFLYAQDGTYVDSFAVAHDYLTDGVTGTIWDGIAVNEGFLDVETEAVINALNTKDSLGTLSFTTTSSYWSGDNDNGAFLYKNIASTVDFELTVKVAGGDFSSNGATAVAYLMAGPMVRRADTISFVAMQVFDQYDVGYGLRSLPAALSSDGNEEHWTKTNAEKTLLTTAAFPYLKLVREGSTYTASCSADGQNWFAYWVESRPDMNGHDLQVGLYNATYTTNTGKIIFDDFKLVEKVRTSASVTNTGSFKAFYSNNRIVINSKTTISNLKLYGIDGALKFESKNVNSGSYSIPVEKRGVYILVSEENGNRFSQKIVAY